MQRANAAFKSGMLASAVLVKRERRSNRAQVIRMRVAGVVQDNPAESQAWKAGKEQGSVDPLLRFYYFWCVHEATVS